MEKWGTKYKFDLNKYITPNTFEKLDKVSERQNIIYFLGNIGFMASIDILIMLYIKYPDKTIYLNDMYWTSKCEDLKGIQCYFSEDSLLVKILNNYKKITAQTLILNLVWIENDHNYSNMKKISAYKGWNTHFLLNRKNYELIRKKISLLFNQMWKLNPEITNIVNSKIAVLKNRKYIGIHIRMGDKIGRFDKSTKEADIPDLYKIPSIVEKIMNLDPEINTIFIATDDNSTIDIVYELLIGSHIKKFYIVTFSTDERQGYDQQKFNKKFSQEESFQSNVAFIVDFSALVNSTYYIGTLSSNVTRFVIMTNNIPYKNIYNIETFSEITSQHIPKFYTGMPINNI